MSDRIKKIKIKQADGTMSDYYPIGADAQNIDFSNGYNLDNIVGSLNPDESGNIATQLSKSIKYYDCVADMKADTTLNGGGAARTLGYYEPNDGGGGLYSIIDTTDSRYETSINDGGSVHDLSNGNKALLIINNKVINLAQMGLATSNNKTINTNIIYNTIKLLKDGGTVLIPMGVYNIDPIIIDFTTRYLTIRGINKDAILQQVTSNDYAIRFTEHQSNITLEDVYIENNSVGSGIAFESTANSGAVHLLRTHIRNCIHGYKLHNVVYLYANEANAGMSGTRCTADSFAFELKGYEYNRIENCACQINGNVDTYIDFPMCKLIDTPFVWIKNCEFVKTGGPGIYIASTGANSIGNIYIDTCELYRVREGVRIAPNTRSLQNINITNCHVTLHGETMGSTAINEHAIHILHEDETSTANCSIFCDNLFVHRHGQTSPGYLIRVEDDLLYSGTFTNISNMFNNQANCYFGNNIISDLSFINPALKGTMSVTVDGTTKRYNCIKIIGTVPRVDNCVPKVSMTPNKEYRSALAGYPFIASEEFYEPDPTTGRFRWMLAFVDQVPPAGTYSFDYQIHF